MQNKILWHSQRRHQGEFPSISTQRQAWQCTLWAFSCIANDSWSEQSSNGDQRGDKSTHNSSTKHRYLSHAMFMSFRSLWNMRNYIHINLCISLIVAQVTFVAGVEPRGSVVGTSYASHMHLTTKFVQWWCLDWVEAFIPANTSVGWPQSRLSPQQWGEERAW